MTRKKVTLAYITNDSARKATFKKRKKGLLKKLSELVTLCDINACAIIYSPYEAQPEVWPSPVGVHRVLTTFKNMPEMEQSKKMVNQESFTKQRILKASDQLKKLRKDNREKEMRQVMFQCLTGRSLFNMNIMELNDLAWLADQHSKEIDRRVEALKKQAQESSVPATTAPVAALPPPPPPPPPPVSVPAPVPSFASASPPVPAASAPLFVASSASAFVPAASAPSYVPSSASAFVPAASVSSFVPSSASAFVPTASAPVFFPSSVPAFVPAASVPSFVPSSASAFAPPAVSNGGYSQADLRKAFEMNPTIMHRQQMFSEMRSTAAAPAPIPALAPAHSPAPAAAPVPAPAPAHDHLGFGGEDMMMAFGDYNNQNPFSWSSYIFP